MVFNSVVHKIARIVFKGKVPQLADECLCCLVWSLCPCTKTMAVNYDVDWSSELLVLGT